MFNATWLLVGAIYAIAVWFARRADVDMPWRIATFFYLIVLIFLWAPLTADVVNLPADFLQILPPWAFLTRLHRSINPEINDLTLQIVPWAHQVRESWRSGHIPLWNNLSGSGYPLLANGQSSALSPIRLLALPLTLGQSFAAEAAMKFLIALSFMYLFCRRRYSELASVIAAISFAFCSFIVVWLHFPLATVSAYVPAALYQIDLLAERRTYGRFVFAACLWTAMLFGGHPETVSHIFFISLLYLGWLIFVRRSFAGARDAWRFVLMLGGALTTAALLAAPLLAPFAEAVTKSRRYSELQSSPHLIGYFSDWASAVLLVSPRFFGAIPFEKPWVTAPSAESITGFAGMLGIAALAAMVVHVIRTRSWRSPELFFIIATIIVVGVMMGWPGISQVFHFVFRLAANARLRLLLCFLLAVQTAAMVDLAERDAKSYLAGIAVCAALLMYLIYGAGIPAGTPRTIAFGSILPGVVVLVVAVLAAFPRFRPIATLLLIVVCINDVWTSTKGWNPTVPADKMYPATPLIEKLQALKEKHPANDPFRIVGTGPVFFPNTPAVYGFEDIRAHDPMANGRYLGTLRVLTGYDTADYFPKWNNVGTPVLDFLNVKYVVTTPRADLHDPERYALVHDGKDGRVFENTSVLPRFFATPNVILEFRNDRYVALLQSHRSWGDTALLKSLPVENDRMRNDLLAPRPKGSPVTTMKITDASASGDEYRMTVSAPRYTFIVSSIAWWPGWKIEANGRKLNPMRVNGTFIGFVVPPGASAVRVWYSPITFWAGAWVSLLTMLTLAAIPFVRRRRRQPAYSSVLSVPLW